MHRLALSATPAKPIFSPVPLLPEAPGPNNPSDPANQAAARTFSGMSAFDRGCVKTHLREEGLEDFSSPFRNSAGSAFLKARKAASRWLVRAPQSRYEQVSGRLF
jgi:hypothetical protein